MRRYETRREERDRERRLVSFPLIAALREFPTAANQRLFFKYGPHRYSLTGPLRDRCTRHETLKIREVNLPPLI